MKITKQQKALWLAADDAAYILEPLLTKQVPAGQVAVAVERVLRISLTDAGLPVNEKTGVVLRGTTVEAEAQRIAAKLTAHAVRGKLAA
jgi:hypothetical protein